MPSTPDIYVADEQCEQVADLVRYRVRSRGIRWSDEQIFRAIVDEVIEHTVRGEWACWSEERKETAVAVAQRITASLLWGSPVVRDRI